MATNNIFQNAEFGNKFKTISGDILLYINEKPHGRFNLYCKEFNEIYTYNCNGVIKNRSKEYGEWLNIKQK